LALVFVLLWKRRAKALLAFSAVALALGGVSLAMVGWQGMLSYPRYVFGIERTMGGGSIVPADMPNLRGFASVFVGPQPGPFVTALLTIIAVALLIWVARRWDQTRGQRFNLAFASTLILAVVISYHAYAYELTVLLLAIVLLLDGSYLMELKSRRGAVLFAPPLLLYLTPLWMVLWFRLNALFILAPVLLLWGWAVVREADVVDGSTESVATSA
jgi:hypothetical protein